MSKRPLVLTNTGNNEWYAPVRCAYSAHLAMGGVDLDPASCAETQHRVGAEHYYTKEDDGLVRPWAGRVWLNPPLCAWGGEPLRGQADCRTCSRQCARGDHADGCRSRGHLVQEGAEGCRCDMPR